MALTTQVKAGSITNLSDARYFSALDVTWIGFALEETSSKAVAPDTVKEMLEWIFGPRVTGEFREKPMREVNHLASYLQLDAVQLGPAYSQADCVEAVVPVLKETELTAETTAANLADSLAAFHGSVDHFVLNGRTNRIDWTQLKAGQPFKSDQLRELCRQFPILLDLGFSDDTVPEVLEEVQPAGLNLTGGEEIEVGVKTFEDLDAIMQKLEIEE